MVLHRATSALINDEKCYDVDAMGEAGRVCPVLALGIIVKLCFPSIRTSSLRTI
jgi:hypothetical protein